MHKNIIKILEEIMSEYRVKKICSKIDYIVDWEEPDRAAGLDIEATKNRICDMIKAKGLKDKAIADKMGITPQAVNKWRHKGTFLVVENLYILSGMLGVSVDDLLVPVTKKKCGVVIEI